MQNPPLDDYVLLLKDGKDHLAPFCTTQGSVRSLVSDTSVRNELIAAGVLIKVRSRWMINPAKFFNHYQEKTRRLVG